MSRHPLEATLDRCAVRAFSGQAIDDDRRAAPARCFGKLQDERGGSILRADELRLPRVFADMRATAAGCRSPVPCPRSR